MHYFLLFVQFNQIRSVIPEETCKTPLFERDEWGPEDSPNSNSSGGGNGRDSGIRRSNNGNNRTSGGAGGNGGRRTPLLKLTPKAQNKRFSPGPGASLLSNSSTESSEEDDEDYDEGKIS